MRSYFENGFEKLIANRDNLKTVSEKVTKLLKEYGIKDVPNFLPLIESGKTLISAWEKSEPLSDISKENKSQKAIAQKTLPFFIKLHELLKIVDCDVRAIEKENNRAKDIRLLKTELEELHREVKDTEYFFTHIHWLQERFPEAQYEDVTGLCKLATLDKVKEQEYSLNPGRYVGVVIEEDGKTEEEFIAEIVGLNDELEALNKEARKLENVIAKNIAAIAGEE